jgi:hypothetical protein
MCAWHFADVNEQLPLMRGRAFVGGRFDVDRLLERGDIDAFVVVDVVHFLGCVLCFCW